MPNKIAIATVIAILQVAACSNQTCSGASCIQTWYVKREGSTSCEPGHDIGDIVRYNKSIDKIFLNSYSCMTFNDNITYVGSCPSNSLKTKLKNNLDTVVPHNVTDLNNAMCSAYNRTGLLCSRCEGDLGPAVLSIFSQCLECHKYGWIFFFLLTFVPATLFSLVIIIFQINTTSPNLNIIIVWCQFFSNLVYLNPGRVTRFLLKPYFSTLFKIASSICGLWNFDFFRYVLPFFCISNKMDMVQVVALEYIAAFYPIFLMALVYYMIKWHDRGCVVLVYAWRPFHKCFSRFKRTWQLKGSVLNAFITFLTLSSAKLLTVSVILIRSIILEDSCGHNHGRRVYLDPSLEAFSPTHLSYAIPAIIVLIFFNVLPTVYITLYPIRRCKRILDKLVPFRLLQELAKMSQKGFKDGTNGTRDYRIFAGLYAFSRFFFIMAIMGKNGTVVIGLTFLFFGILVIGCHPYKKMRHNVFDFFIIMTICTLTLIFYLARISSVITGPILSLSSFLLSLPFVYILSYICWITAKKLYLLSKGRCKRCRKKQYAELNDNFKVTRDS